MDEYGTFGTLYSHLLFCFDYPRYEYDLGPHSGHERWLSKNTMDDGRRTTGCGFGRGLRSGRHCGGHAALSRYLHSV
ncbi:Uncharacterised protein [Vibrio cholerae]|nr:Uncharacterised protein [Vibrio cholerae]CSC61738.1 Uncharacterised protein [Vibrio cholerae]